MRVLLVDPEGDLLPGLQGPLLGVPGVELYCAPDGATAIQHAGFLGGVDVLLTEVFLEGLDGFALRDTLQNSIPALRTIFLTRHDLSAYESAIQKTPVLTIPVNPGQLLPLVSPSSNRSVASVAQPGGPTSREPRALRPVDASVVKEPAKPAPVIRTATTATTAPAQTNLALKVPGIPATTPTATPTGGGTPVATLDHTADPTPTATPVSPALNMPPATPDRPIDNPARPVRTEANHPLPSTNQSVAPSVPSSVTPPSPEPFPKATEPPPLGEGLVLGPYKLLRENKSTQWGPTFTAVHSTLGRPVTLVILSRQQAETQHVREEFLAEASAKAGVEHPSMLAVYEACELDGHTFYTMEQADGLTLLELAERKTVLSVEVALRLARLVAEGMQYLRAHKISHAPLRASSALLTADGSPRLENLALGGLRPGTSEAEDVATLGRCLDVVLGWDTPLVLRSLLERTALHHQKKVSSWKTFLEGVAECEAAWTKFTANSGPNPEVPVSQSRKHSRLPLLVAAFAILAAAATVFYFKKTKNPLVSAQIQIPKGQYVVAGGKRVLLERFSIDCFEVSNRQYGRFLDWQRTHPTEAASFDHPSQPARLSHAPPYWKDMFPEVARHRAEVDDPRWDLPVTEVTWWDAYSFAHWAGRDLPTEEEWEAAGRGPRGLLFPWGDEPDPDRSNVKRLPRPGEVPAAQAVETQKDPSAFGVYGLSGNVSEWTSTLRDEQNAVAKGGHFNAPLLSLDAASPLPPDTRSPFLGFRTVNRKSTRP
jgi:hypothetical protein